MLPCYHRSINAKFTPKNLQKCNKKALQKFQTADNRIFHHLPQTNNKWIWMLTLKIQYCKLSLKNKIAKFFTFIIHIKIALTTALTPNIISTIFFWCVEWKNKICKKNQFTFSKNTNISIFNFVQYLYDCCFFTGKKPLSLRQCYQ